jgi:16S rRNA (cytosine1402-N4)-methyltransferase
MSHVPVLVGRATRIVFSKTHAPRVLDLTLGTGGYSSSFLNESPECKVVGVDRDPTQLVTVESLSKKYGDRFSALCPRTWSSVKAGNDLEHASFDAVVADLGLCTTQLNDLSRGFSFRGSDKDPLDMRMSKDGRTAADYLNTVTEQEMIATFAQLGQEPLQRAKAITARIVKERPLRSVAQLSKILRTEKTMLIPKHLDPATLVFQALRMTVNEEVKELIDALTWAPKLLKPNGVLVVVSFHSIEDRIVKKFFQLSSLQKDKETPCFEKSEEFLRPDEEEIGRNPKASSATLRFAYRNALPFVNDVSEKLFALALKRKV